MRLEWEIAKRGWRRYAAYPWATAVRAGVSPVALASPLAQVREEPIYLGR